MFKDKDGTIIYVGKAKILKNRLTSYFMGAHEGKTQRLVSEIHDFEYIVTSSELESFVLEINMIKEAIQQLSKKENLSHETAAEVMNEIMSGKASDVHPVAAIS